MPRQLRDTQRQLHGEPSRRTEAVTRRPRGERQGPGLSPVAAAPSWSCRQARACASRTVEGCPLRLLIRWKQDGPGGQVRPK